MQNLTQALQGSKEALKATEAQLSKMEVEAQVQQKAVDDNLAAMRLERDHLANLNSVLTKQKERPIGVDASGMIGYRKDQSLLLLNSALYRSDIRKVMHG